MIDLAIIPHDLNGQNVVVLGAGRSGISAAILAARYGAVVWLSDLKPLTLDQETISRLENHAIAWELGAHSSKVFSADLVVLSPGIPNDAPVVRQIESRGIPIVSEVELAYWFCPTRDIIAVTGSNGKTTTTSLIYEFFKNTSYEPYCGGNIGISFSQQVLEALESRHQRQIFILELSSFQLERIRHFRPHVALMLNISNDHMDRYDHDLMAYFRSKLRIALNQTPNDFYIYNDDDPLVAAQLPDHCQTVASGLHSTAARPVYIERDFYRLSPDVALVATAETGLLGEHNQYNTLAALNAALIYEITPFHLKEVLKSFRGIEHRLEYVATIRRVLFYNDSKATNVDAVRYALRSFSQPVIVILGGKDKDSDFSSLLPELKQRVRHAILIGQAASKIRTIIDGVIPWHQTDSMENAVREGFDLAEPGEVVLLAPACASFDMFDNYEHRGRVFKQAVRQLAGEQC